MKKRASATKKRQQKKRSSATRARKAVAPAGKRIVIRKDGYKAVLHEGPRGGFYIRRHNRRVYVDRKEGASGKKVIRMHGWFADKKAQFNKWNDNRKRVNAERSIAQANATLARLNSQ